MGDSGNAIGIFDSGMGGLTVARQVIERLPGERIVYLGDTARLPYGTKSPETVVRYARACAQVLLKRGIKLLVVACNTASAYALEDLRAELDIPVMGVVEPGARRAVDASQSGRIGVIGTRGTIRSDEYRKAIHAIKTDAEIFSTACPLLVPLAEENWTTGQVPADVTRAYLVDLLDKDIDTLILGCTHYPLLADVIAQTAGPSVTVVDSAEATAVVVEDTLSSMDLLTAGESIVNHQFLVSDAPEDFARTGKSFLGAPIENVQWVDF